MSLNNKPTLKGGSYFVTENYNLSNDSLPDDENLGNSDQTPEHIYHNAS